MGAPETPPPRLRRTVSHAERAEIEHVLGPIGDDTLLRAVRDGRGRTFQRLEFVGDSVLDLVLNVHRWVEVDCARCADGDAGREASDRHLAMVAHAAGLGAWLEWQASDERLADLVETCVAACWLSGQWAQVAPFVTLVVHPLGAATSQALASGRAGEPGKSARRVGSALLELAAGWAVYRDLPDVDEGALSEARAQSHRASFVATRAQGIGDLGGVRFVGSDDEMLLSQVEDALSGVLSSRGADTALAAARGFITTSPH